MTAVKLAAALFVAALTFSAPSGAQAPSATGGVLPNLAEAMDRPLRYCPDGADFVIENGAETFNRPLYGGNTAFRVDGGDRPEFVLYLPGRGGNLRLGLAHAGTARWLHDAKTIVTRYRPGTLLYEIRDPLLGADGVMRLEVVALAETEGVIIRTEATGIAPGVELIWAYGGINGERGVRDGDIGSERVPISEWFQLKPDFAAGNHANVAGDRFTITAAAGTIAGSASPGARYAIADATDWSDPMRLLAGEANAARPVVTGRQPLVSGQPVLIALQRIDNAQAGELADYVAVTTAGKPTAAKATVLRSPAFTSADLPMRFAEAQAHFTALRNRVRIETPDPYLDAAMGALNVAADAVWDGPQQAIMHGAIAWRAKLLGWRGPYSLDALGWHDRADRHLRDWAARQNISAIPPRLPPADEASNLARNEIGLHSNGDLSNSHYDMNLVYIDALFRHLNWTGDRALAAALWPVIERHLAWERRLFRREYGPQRLPLYEAYAAIWASDDLQYHGGGTTHGSAYNLYHNRMAARLAHLLGKDPALYEREAGLISRAMRDLLWLPEGGFAEYKDLLGAQAVHPSAALWSFYHAMDSAFVTPRESWAMADAVTQRLPHLPVKGPGVPDGLGMYATTDWMPYSWSINNVVMGENLHTALGLWQAGRAEDAHRLTRSAILASMYMGISPGNVGTLNYLDVYRRESQRDFADGAGVMSRTIIEGLFGVRPDALAGTMEIMPGLPADWPHAALHHPDIDLRFARTGDMDRWTVSGLATTFRTLRLRLPAPRDGVASITVDGRPVAWTAEPAIGRPILRLDTPISGGATIVVRWGGASIPPVSATAQVMAFRTVRQGAFSWDVPAGTIPLPAPPPTPIAAPSGKMDPIDLARAFNDRVTAIFAPGKYRSPRSPLVSLALPAQGIGAWAGHVNASATIDDSGLRRVAATNGGRLLLPEGTPFITPGPGEAANVAFVSQWDNYPRELTMPLSGKASSIRLLMAGSTNHMQSRIDNGEVIVTYTDGGIARLPLRNPDNWWPIDQDYFIDDYQFRRTGPVPTRIDLASGLVRTPEAIAFKGKGRVVPGGAATALALALDRDRPLRSVTVRALANEVVIGLMAVTLERP